MSINIGDNFSYLGKKFLDKRQSFETLEELMACTDVPKGFISYCVENETRYEFKNGEWIEFINEVDLTDYALKEDIPTKVSELENDRDYATKEYVDEAIIASEASKIPFISTSSAESALVKTGENLILDIDFYSATMGDGTLKVFANDNEVLSVKVPQGISTTNVPGDKFKEGDNTIVVYVMDRAGKMSNSLTFYIRYGGTKMTSSFDPYSYYEYGSTIRYYFTPSALDTSKELTFYIMIDGLLQAPLTCVSDTRTFFTFPSNITVGSHLCEAWVTDGELESSRHVFNLVLVDDTSIVVATDTYEAEEEEGDQVSIDYKVYSKNLSSFIVKVYVDNNLVSTGSCGLAMNYYKTSSLKEGEHVVRIEAWNESGTIHGYCECEVTITESTFQMLTPIIAGSTFIGTAVNRSNADENRDKWVGDNQDGRPITATLHEFVFDTNDGWGNDLLTLNGTANVHIPLSPLASNARYGFTLDITFSTKAVGVDGAEVLTLWDDEKDCGIKITTEEVIMKSASGKICDLYFSEDTLVNAMFIIDREQKMAKIYLNGVMCEAFALSDYENNGIQYLEDFATNSEIYLNKFGGYSQIKEIRIYEVALTTDEIMNNFISTKTSKNEQQALVEFQKGDTLPTLTVYCDFSGLGKDDKKPCDIVYNSPDPLLYGESFSLEGKTSLLQYQGTSSMAYPIKNYRLNLRDENGDKWKYNPFPSGQKEARFTLKADFMSSGHWQNTGLAKWINDNLYNYNPKDEKSMSPIKWYDVQNGVPMNAHRESICGFPCRLILVNDGTTPLNTGQYEPTPGNTKDMGVFNFNNDKDNTDTLGFDTDIFPYCASYEVTANSDTSAGAFMSYEQGIHSELEHEANGALTVQADNICHRHSTTINEIRGNTENGISVGVRQGNGTYNVEIVVSNANQDNYQERTLLINIPTALRRNGDAVDRMYWDDNDKHYYIEQWVDPNTGDALTEPNIIASGIVKKLELKHYTGQFSVDVRNLSPSYMKVTVPYFDVPSDYVYREEDEVEYFKESFELRFPDEDDVGSDYGFAHVNGDYSMGLKRLIDWVDKSTDEEFVRDFEQYFHKQYTLRYYLLVIVLG